ncbi:MAG TPA: YesL family protein [Propionibacteriaceae bacterium]|nr:YesL family protein [Propionibacteriaceae bacterium]
MQFDPQARSIQGLLTMLGLVLLNLVYLVSCLPVITIGAATSALFEVTFRLADEDRGRLVSDYLDAVRRNAVRGTLVFLALAPAIGVLGFAAVFWSQLRSPFALAATLLAVLGAVYLVAALLYALAQVALFDTTVGRTLRNALLLPMAEPLTTVAVLLIPLTCLSLLVAVHGFVVIVLTIGFSVGSYASAFLFRRAFARHQGAPA